MKAKKGKRELYCQAEPVPSSMPKSRSNVLFNDDASATRGTENGSSNFVLEMDQMQEQVNIFYLLQILRIICIL